MTTKPQNQNTTIPVLITGSAGFVGYHAVKRFLEAGYEVWGIDNINDYYDPQLKLDRLSAAGIGAEALQWGKEVVSTQHPEYRFVRMNLEDKESLDALFSRVKFARVIHLAAQPGVRYSLENPSAYVQSNVVGFLNILEACRQHQVEHLVYASSSSVYGMSREMPLSVKNNVDHPVSLYAATKKSNELMAHTYSHLFGLPTTGLRFFTVYGPWGRPDMATHLFASAITEGRTIKVFNEGKLSRDFTHVRDIVEGVYQVSTRPPQGSKSNDHRDPSTSDAPYRLYNIGNSQPVQLMDFIRTMEQAIGKEAKKEFLPMQPGDVKDTYADVTALEQEFGYRPTTSLTEGLQDFVKWFNKYYS